MRILKNPWKKDFLDLVRNSRTSIKITSPFIKENICDELISQKQTSSTLQLYTSFKLMNIYFGSLDLSGLEQILLNNGSILNVPRLHSKIYLFDDKKVIITSGNLTNGGLLTNFEYGIHSEDPKIVSAVVKDLTLLDTNEDVGDIKQKDIEIVRKIIDALPKTEKHETFFHDSDTPEDLNGVIKLSEETLLSALSGWKLEVFKCIQMIGKQNFSLNEVFHFENHLKQIYPQNRHIREKIRQQLQRLRDIGLIEFLGNGKYRKLWI